VREVQNRGEEGVGDVSPSWAKIFYLSINQSIYLNQAKAAHRKN